MRSSETLNAPTPTAKASQSKERRSTFDIGQSKVRRIASKHFSSLRVLGDQQSDADERRVRRRRRTVPSESNEKFDQEISFVRSSFSRRDLDVGRRKAKIRRRRTRR